MRVRVRTRVRPYHTEWEGRTYSVVTWQVCDATSCVLRGEWGMELRWVGKEQFICGSEWKVRCGPADAIVM
jgi:hypothetical protein